MQRDEAQIEISSRRARLHARERASRCPNDSRRQRQGHVETPGDRRRAQEGNLDSLGVDCGVSRPRGNRSAHAQPHTCVHIGESFRLARLYGDCVDMHYRTSRTNTSRDDAG